MNFVETDLLLMSLCVFLPSVFALALVFFPKGSEEAMRWTALVGTAITFVVSTWVFIDYHKYLDERPDPTIAGARSFSRADAEKTSLAYRTKIADGREADNAEHYQKDVLARYPWIPRFS